MIPSDHFVRFYNEVFKFLEAEGEEDLQNYWLAISKHQERHVVEKFRKEGFAGMEKYWRHIEFEENAEMSFERDEEHLDIHMNKCPSLSKAIDNDAGAMHRYCDHCAGWIGPIMDKLGYHVVYDMIDRQKPQCQMLVFKDAQKAKAAKASAKLPATWPKATQEVTN